MARPRPPEILPPVRVPEPLDDPALSLVPHTVADIKNALSATAGIISDAAAILNMDRKDLTRIIEEDPFIREHLHHVTEATLDLAEGKLLEHIRGGELQAVIFYLKCKGKARGWNDKLTVVGDPNQPVPHLHGVNLTRFSTAQLEQLVLDVKPVED